MSKEFMNHDMYLKKLHFEKYVWNNDWDQDQGAGKIFYYLMAWVSLNQLLFSSEKY